MKIYLKLFILMFFMSCSTLKSTKSDTEKIELNYKTGELKSKGNYSVEYLPIYKLRLGEWKEFYKNGKIKSIGNYDIGRYEECCTGGICDGFYNYKVGDWIFYYQSGKIKAKGKFDLNKFKLKTSCEGGDEIVFGIAQRNKWEFYDEEGAQIEHRDKLIEEIEKTKTNGSFPETTFLVDRRTKNIIWEE